MINVDKNAASPKAMAQLKAAGLLPEQVELQPGQIPQSPHRARPPRASNGWSSPGWASFPWKRPGERVLSYEVMHMIRKGQVHGVGKGDIQDQVSFIASLFGVAA